MIHKWQLYILISLAPKVSQSPQTLHAKIPKFTADTNMFAPFNKQCFCSPWLVQPFITTLQRGELQNNSSFNCLKLHIHRSTDAYSFEILSQIHLFHVTSEATNLNLQICDRTDQT